MCPFALTALCLFAVLMIAPTADVLRPERSPVAVLKTPSS